MNAPAGAPLRFAIEATMFEGAGCLEWPYARSQGYGVLHLDGRKIGAHQAVLGAWHTPKPGEEVRHTCDNRACVNPMHLLFGSRQDNVNDMLARGRHWRQTWARL